MQSRFPNANWENGKTAAPYSVFEGFSDLFEDFEAGLGAQSRARGCMAIFSRPTGWNSPGASRSITVPVRQRGPARL
jgi:hypothetical protein